MSQDFFDEEFEKVKQEEQKKVAEEKRRQAMDDWYNYSNSPNGTGAKSNVKETSKPWYVALICVALVVAIALGWVLCAIFGGSGNINSKKEQQRYMQTVVNAVCEVLSKGQDEKITLSQQQLNEIFATASNATDSGQLYNEAIMSSVFDYLRTVYYKDISETQWQQAVATAGNALIQSAGDRFCQLMTPQDYYNFVNQVSNTSIVGGVDYFGVSYSFSAGLGLYVSDVVTDSSCYGILQPGDIVLKLSDIVYSDALVAQNNFTLEKLDEIVLADYDSDTVTKYMAVIKGANFRYLRDGDVRDSGVIYRGKVGLNVDSNYDYQFIEFYFNNTVNNISMPKHRENNTYDLRFLSKLPADTGYVRITEFMYYMDGASRVTVADEFTEVMDIFKTLGKKRLVLDLKGNPGGLVDAVSTIAGMLVSDAKLTNVQQTQVTRGNQLLITSLQPKDGPAEKTYRPSTYSKYFADPKDKCDIVVWTDGNSASASELLTGALRDYGTGFQIGNKTYGKGIAQTYEPLPYTGSVVTTNGVVEQGHWAIYYTFAAYYSPLGDNIHGKGYTPMDGYNNIDDYQTLWEKTYLYWGING